MKILSHVTFYTSHSMFWISYCLVSCDLSNQSFAIDEELADILIYVCAIANRCEINLEDAFRRKEEINKKRIWK